MIRFRAETVSKHNRCSSERCTKKSTLKFWDRWDSNSGQLGEKG